MAPAHNNGKDLIACAPNDILSSILAYLDVPSILSFTQCSKGTYLIASDCNAWSEKCEELWRGKMYICKEARKGLKCRSAFALSYRKRSKIDIDHKHTYCQCCKEAYRCSYLDSFRHNIKTEELCNFIWSFRFKESAGTDWIMRDPWWSYKKARKVIFLPDGQVLQVISSENTGHMKKRKASHQENTGNIEVTSVHNVFSGNDSENSINQKVSWKFITSPLDLPRRNIGGYLKISIGDREIPTYVVRRSPTKNWGFIIENCWGVFSSFEMPLKHKTLALEDVNLLVANSWQWKEALRYNMNRTYEIEPSTSNLF